MGEGVINIVETLILLGEENIIMSISDLVLVSPLPFLALFIFSSYFAMVEGKTWGCILTGISLFSMFAVPILISVFGG